MELKTALIHDVPRSSVSQSYEKLHLIILLQLRMHVVCSRAKPTKSRTRECLFGKPVQFGIIVRLLFQFCLRLVRNHFKVKRKSLYIRILTNRFTF